jgi:glycerol kinase
LDSIAYQVNDILSAMEADANIALAQLKVDGGASANNYLMQTQSDLSGAPVVRPGCVETTAMGAAYLAGLAVGYWQNMDEICRNWALDRTFTPEITPQQRRTRLENWKRAVQCAVFWSQHQPNS